MDKSLLEQIEDIAVYTTVVNQGSFSGAGRFLGVSKSAVSKRVDRLERSLSTKLLQRSTRSLSMTEAGRSIYEKAAQSIEILEEARNQVSNLTETPQGIIKLTTSVAFGKLCIAPLLPEFLKRYPLIRVQLALFDRTVDLADEGFDLAIRLTKTPPEFLVAKPLMSIDYVLCASPAYLDGKIITSPNDLTNLNCLSYGYQKLANEWAFQNDGQTETVKVSGNLVVNSSEVVRDLMLAGIGIGLVARYAVEKDLQTGALKEVIPDWRPTGSFNQTAYAIWQPQTHLPQKTRLFVDFVKKSLEQNNTQIAQI